MKLLFFTVVPPGSTIARIRCLGPPPNVLVDSPIYYDTRTAFEESRSALHSLLIAPRQKGVTFP